MSSDYSRALAKTLRHVTWSCSRRTAEGRSHSFKAVRRDGWCFSPIIIILQPSASLSACQVEHTVVCSLSLAQSTHTHTCAHSPPLCRPHAGTPCQVSHSRERTDLDLHTKQRLRLDRKCLIVSGERKFS